MVSKAERKANNKWDNKHKHLKKVYTYRSASRRFLKSYATLRDLNEAEKLINNRRHILECNHDKK